MANAVRWRVEQADEVREAVGRYTDAERVILADACQVLLRFPGALTFPTRQDLFTLPVSLVNLQQGTYGQLDDGLLSAGAVRADSNEGERGS